MVITPICVPPPSGCRAGVSKQLTHTITAVVRLIFTR